MTTSEGQRPDRPAGRILMLTPDVGYLDRRIAQEAASLAALGWTVDIHPTDDAGLEGGDLPPGVRLRRRAVTLARPGMRWQTLRHLKRGIGRTVPGFNRAFEMTRYSLVDRAGATASANVAELETLPPYDLVFAHDIPVMPLAVRLRARWGSPIVCDLHEIYPEQDEFFTTAKARGYWRDVEAAAIADADGILAVNDAVADYVRDRYQPTAPIGVVRNSVPFVPQASLHGVSIRDLYEVPPSARIMLFAGSLRPHKNLEAVIEGFGRSGLEGWVLAILGEGPLLPELVALVRRLRLERTVFLGKRVEQEELIAATSSADFGLLPYQGVGLNHQIATPNKLYEYIAARLPIATSRLPMIERAITTHQNGSFVDFATAETTAAGMRTFVERDLPTITEVALEAAAVTVSWERDATEVVRIANAVRPSKGA